MLACPAQCLGVSLPEDSSADIAAGYSGLTVARIIAEGIISPQHAPNGGERLAIAAESWDRVCLLGDLESSLGGLPVMQAGARPTLSAISAH